MIKDRLLKEKLLRYFLRRGWYPSLEVAILSKQRISSVKKLITDVDVLGMHTDVTGMFRPILGDCKTLKNQSPISRVLWLRGLMDYLEAEKGFIVLDKPIEREHQLTSNLLNIQLLSDSDLETFARATTDYIEDINSALGNIEYWDALFEIDKRFPQLAQLVDFSKSEFWNQKSSYQLRLAISHLRTYRGELNPSNNLHLAFVLNLFSLIAIALNNIVVQIFSQYLIPSTKEDLDLDLRIIIWGGIENYNYLNDMRKRFAGETASKDLVLPEWEKFLELVRSIFENPLEFAPTAIFLKELAFELLSTSDYSYKKKLANKNRYITAYAVKLAEYLCYAAMLPKDFRERFSGKILEVEV